MNLPTSDPSASAWVQPIRNYLHAHPYAGDSAEGIARWWLGAPVAEWPHIRQALQSMVADGQLECHAAADGREHYRLPAAAVGTPP